MSKKRPLSPHLQIYKPQITSTLSILHRITGFVLFFGGLLLSGWLITASLNTEAFYVAQAIAKSFLGQMVLFSITLALFYHFSNGIRHLFWDFGIGFEMKHVRTSGYFVIGMTLILSFLTWLFAYSLVAKI